MSRRRRFVIKAKLVKRVMDKTKFFIGERVNYEFCPQNYWDETGFDKTISAIYDAGYVRYKTFEMLSSIIKENKIEGDIAELGVYQGRTSYGLNWLFPDRKLYLFDTFEGFNEEQFEEDKKNGFLDKGMKIRKDSFYDLNNTNENVVLSRMPFKEQCIIKKGLFPETITADVKNSTFSLVSIDADLYKPTLDGLEFFYPRLNLGGYIVIHDYNHGLFEGVKKAVDDYEISNGLLCKFPVADFCGSIVISK